jgi:hypothetical protein
MKKGRFPRIFIHIALGIGFLWPTLSCPMEAYKDLKKRDLHYLETLKGQLEQAENMPGGLERARELKRQIDAIERGTDIYVPGVQSFQEAQLKEAPSLPEPVSMEEQSPTGPLTLNETTAGNELDLFHENTITVGEDYGVPRSVIDANQPSKETRIYKPLDIPSTLPLKNPNAPRMYATPTAAPAPQKKSETSVPVDAPLFQKPSTPLYGTPPGYQPDPRPTPSSAVVPTMHQSEAAPAPWNIDQREGVYLEEKLRAKLAQLAHARKKLQTCTGQEADAWTSRIYDLETEKRSLLRMMKSLGVTPKIKTVSLQEDPEFDTIQSQEYQLIRQLNDIEKQEKKVRRQMRFSKDPEAITNAGDLLSRLEQNRKLLETSLKTLKLNSANVDPTSFVERPTIYQPVKQPKAEEDKEEIVEIIEEEIPEMPPVQKILPPTQAQTSHPQEIDIMADDDDECPITNSTGFWTSSVPNGSKRALPPMNTPSRPDREDVKEVVRVWKAG